MSENIFSKAWYKFFNKNKYLDIKNKQRTYKNIKYYDSHVYEQIVEIQKKITNSKELSFLHSGQMGDIIYSLATIKELSKTHKCRLYIQVNKPLPMDHGTSGRKFFLDERTANLFLPLLKHQDFLETAEIYNGNKIDINLDLFRDIPINPSFYSSRWFSHICGINIDVTKTFLSVKPHQSIKNKIIVGRSPRYRNAFLNYKFLKDTKNLLSIGLESEFNELKKDIKNLEFYKCEDFLEMAAIIKGSKFLIGNMSLQYITSEALKVPRLLEASPEFPVAFPVGPNSFDAYHQIHFEKYFSYLNK
jgi:hypothetical protein